MLACLRQIEPALDVFARRTGVVARRQEVDVDRHRQRTRTGPSAWLPGQVSNGAAISSPASKAWPIPSSQQQPRRRPLLTRVAVPPLPLAEEFLVRHDQVVRDGCAGDVPHRYRNPEYRPSEPACSLDDHHARRSGYGSRSSQSSPAAATSLHRRGHLDRGILPGSPAPCAGVDHAVDHHRPRRSADEQPRQTGIQVVIEDDAVHPPAVSWRAPGSVRRRRR